MERLVNTIKKDKKILSVSIVKCHCISIGLSKSVVAIIFTRF